MTSMPSDRRPGESLAHNLPRARRLYFATGMDRIARLLPRGRVAEQCFAFRNHLSHKNLLAITCQFEVTATDLCSVFINTHGAFPIHGASSMSTVELLVVE